ncbi:MAG TPA: class I SAM-dependent methyltransferase [Bacteroidia bacterium]|nr:class I SAM-dependent methyltransferase [Bacteroidia bacterium]
MAEEYFKACLLCGSENVSPLKKYVRHHLVKCSNCGFVFSRRKPTLQELLSIYDYYPIFQTVSPITLQRFDDILKHLEPFRKTNNLIDIGSGDGYFSERAKQQGWNVYGTEFTDAKVEYSRRKGIIMHKGVLDVKNYSPGFFDVLISIEVIEHINNPREEIAKFSELLRPGGAVYLTTPNFNSVSRHLLGKNWNIVAYPEHLSYYTKKTLKQLFESSGFKTRNIITSGISFSRIQQSTNEKSREGEFTYTDENIRQKVESNFFLRSAKEIINMTLNIFNAGDSLKAVFVKR